MNISVIITQILIYSEKHKTPSFKSNMFWTILIAAESLCVFLQEMFGDIWLQPSVSLVGDDGAELFLWPRANTVCCTLNPVLHILHNETRKIEMDMQADLF